MPVTIGINELAADLGLTDGTSAPRQPARAILELHLSAATPIIETWAMVDCPDGVLNLAVVRLAGYWYDQPAATANTSFANALVNSGAAAALRQWRVEPSAVIDGE